VDDAPKKGGEGKAPSGLDDLYHGKKVRRHVLEFGSLFGAIFLGVAAYRIWKGYGGALTYLAPPLGVAFLFLGAARPALLVPLWRGWMGLALVLNRIMTPVLLFLLWWTLVVPIGLLLRVLRIHPLTMSFRTNEESYWIPRDPKKNDFKLLERQF
jgi:hypothetical protein